MLCFVIFFSKSSRISIVHQTLELVQVFMAKLTETVLRELQVYHENTEGVSVPEAR